MNTHHKILAATVLLSSVALVSGQSLVYQFNFNDNGNGTSTVSTGSNTGSASMINHPDAATFTPTNLRGSVTSGLTGVSGDYAFDNSASSKMGGSGAAGGGTAGFGGVATLSGGASALSGVTSFTLAGWYNASSTPGNFARLIELGNTSLFFSANGTLQATAAVNGESIGGATTRFTGSNATLSLTDTWVFFAFTYDGATGNAGIYAGTSAGNLSLVSSTTLATGVIATSSSGLFVGNTGGSTTLYERPFDGLLDNIRVYAGSDSSSALSLAQLQGVISSDVSAVPEPSTTAALAGAAVLGLAALRRRRS